MIKRIVLLVIIFILSLPTPVLADEAGGGRIEGQIVNGTAEGSSVAEQDIALKTYLNDTEVGTTATKTDSEGLFVFDGLSTELDYGYQVVLTFQEAEYYSEWLNFDEGEIIKSVEVTVYDSTTSDEAIEIATAHTIIYVGQGSLQVTEYFQFGNETDRTYIGAEEVTTEGDRETLGFFLPSGATGLELTYGLMECCIVTTANGFTDTMPVLPGGREVAYSYTVDYNSSVYEFWQKANYPIINFDLFIQGASVEVSGDHLTAGESLDISGTPFNYFSSQELASGDVLITKLSGLPQTDDQGLVIWAALALLVLLGGLVFGYLLRKKRVQPVSPEDSPDQLRQRLLVELAQLDDNFEGGKIAEEAYRRLRAERKTQLAELMRGSKEELGNR